MNLSIVIYMFIFTKLLFKKYKKYLHEFYEF